MSLLTTPPRFLSQVLGREKSSQRKSKGWFSSKLRRHRPRPVTERSGELLPTAAQGGQQHGSGEQRESPSPSALEAGRSDARAGGPSEVARPSGGVRRVQLTLRCLSETGPTGGHGDQRADAGLCRPKLSGGRIRRSPKQNTCPKPLTGDRCVYEPAGDQPGESPKQLGDSLKEFLRVLPYQVRARTT